MAESSQPGEFSGRAAVVTGGSSGIGRQIAIELAQRGADVLIHARKSREQAEQVAKDISEMGRNAQCVFADLADPSDAVRLVNEAWAWRSDLDMWINNAGADVLTGEMASCSFFEKLDVLWSVDVRGGMQVARDVGKRLYERGAQATAPAIVTIGWDQVETGMAGDAGEMFGAIKGAVMAFSRSLARSLAPRVRVNCVAPGWIRTAWGEQASDYWNDRAKRESLLERWGRPDDVADAVCFLASSRAGFITGQTLNVNGGFRNSD